MVMNVMNGKMEKPGFVMMIGLPGSGKSYFSNIYSNNLKNMRIPNIILSSDKIRKELYGDESIQDNPDKVFQIMEERTINNLKNNISVVYDATNINYKNRMNLLKKLPDCWKIALIIWIPYQMCLERNKNRERVVPENAIKKMYKSFNPPHFFEGWDFIDVVNNSCDFCGEDIQDRIERLNDFSQDNPHHTLTLGQHLLSVANNARVTHPGDFVLYEAGLLHDIGKEFTKNFHDNKGNVTDVAHYYGHASASAYEAIYYVINSHGFEKEMIDVLAVIAYHMFPMNWNSEKTKEKYRKLWGDDLYNWVSMLHDIDVDGK